MRINIGFGVALALLLGVGLIAYQSFMVVGSRTHNREIQLMMEVVLATVKDGETAQRGFLLTNRESYLEPYNKARATFGDSLEKLHAALEELDDEQQLHDYDRLEPLLMEKMEFLAREIDVRKSAGLHDAMELLLSDRGKVLMDQIQLISDRIIARQERFVQIRLESREKSVRHGTLAILSGTSLAAVLILLMLLLLKHDAKQRAKVEEERDRFFSMSLDMLGVISHDGYFKRLNPAFERVLGYKLDELLAQPITSFLHPDDVKRTLEMRAQMSLGGPISSFENRFRCKDGSYRWLSWNAMPVGQMRYAAARDVTEMKEEQTSHLAEMERLASVIDLQYKIAAIGFDVDKLMGLVVSRAQELTSANGAVIEMADGDEMVYKAASGTAAKSLGLRLKRASSLSGACVESGEILICRDSHDDTRVDRVACDRIGLRSMVVVPLRHGTNVVGVLKVYSETVDAFSPRDVSLLEILSGYLAVMLERVSDADALKKRDNENRLLNERLEARVIERTQELEESRDRFKMVTENISDVLWMANADRSKIIYISPAYEKIFGKSRESLNDNSNSFAESIHPEDRERVLATLPNQETGQITFQYRIVTSDNSIKWIRTTSTPIKNRSGEIYRIVGVSSDITESRNALLAEKEALEASRSKSEFLANMSHEIRTPINGVMGMANLLQDTTLSEDQRSYTGSIVSSAENLLTLVNDILDLSKAEAGKIELEKVDFELAQIIRDVENTLLFSAHKKNLQLLHTVGPGVPTFCHGDPTRLRQVLMNLAGNAIKFTGQGQVKVSASARLLAPGKHEVRFEIADTGIGIPASALPRMFQAFSQADASTTRKFGGTGLGLSISKRLVELMGGEIGVNSAEKTGSVFWFTIPLEAAKDVVAISSRVASPILSAASKMRILLAEDNSVNQLIAVKMLEKMGHSVIAVSNGNEVLDALRMAPYDLVLMDCQMPEMDGYEASRLIRNSATLPCWDIPIVAMTANAMSGDREKCLAAGMNDYISKPVRPAELQACVERFSPGKIAA